MESHSRRLSPKLKLLKVRKALTTHEITTPARDGKRSEKEGVACGRLRDPRMTDLTSVSDVSSLTRVSYVSNLTSVSHVSSLTRVSYVSNLTSVSHVSSGREELG